MRPAPGAVTIISMLRDPSLVPLSHQHQHALALCVRLDRGLQGPGPAAEALVEWNREVAQIFSDEISYHFAAEEAVLFPELGKYAELGPLIAELLGEHQTLREIFQKADDGALDRPALVAFGETLSSHVRKEERVLFEKCQELVPPERLAALGRALDEYFGASGMPGASCALR
jgi:hemerythrin superfamily protein